MIKKTFLSFLLSFFYLPLAFAYSDYIIAGGENIGIELKSKGVMVVGFYKVDGSSISDVINIGDIITSINNQEINSVNDLTKAIKNSDGNIKISYINNDITKFTNVKLYKDSEGTYKTGMYVKDSITGIGTLTYIDPNTKVFGALGHEIVDSRTGKIFSVKSGTIYESNVTGVEPSKIGSPGEKNALVQNDKINGTIFENTNKGIFGNYTNTFDNARLYKVAKNDEIKKGKAKILTVLDGNTINEYEINITKINNKSDTKNLSFEITDEALLSKTNGIIQGMSGSPIIQDDKIIGAVTHVVVDDPHKGYGIFITKMLEEGEN